MSILTELTRIRGEIAKIITALKSKGVNVPDDAKIADIAGHVSNIVTPNLQAKTVAPQTYSQDISPDTDKGYNGLSKVTVNAIKPISQFGTAKQPDVKKGVTFTSFAGIQLTGSYEEGVGTTLPNCEVTVEDNDWAQIYVWVIANENGRLIWKETIVPLGGSVAVPFAFGSPILVTSDYGIGYVDVYTYDDDYERNAKIEWSNDNWFAAIVPDYDVGGRYHKIICFL